MLRFILSVNKCAIDVTLDEFLNKTTFERVAHNHFYFANKSKHKQMKTKKLFMILTLQCRWLQHVWNTMFPVVLQHNIFHSNVIVHYFPK